MEKKEDLRVKKTKKNLYVALIKLMEDKSFENIKVSDICSISLTNRSTFYDHFNDKYELLASLIHDLEQELETKLKENTSIETAKEYYMNMIELLICHISENMQIYTSMLKNNNNSIAYDMFFEALLKDVEKNLNQSSIYKGDIPTPIITTFYVSAVVNVCLLFIKDPKQYKKEEILNYISKLLPNTIY